MEAVGDRPLVWEEKAAVSAIRSPWDAYLAVAGVACLPIGLIWDISWHISVGRDTFWTLAHIVIQLGGILPALVFGIKSLKTTFGGTASERASSVRFLGAYGSFGGWVTIWGSFAMLVSAPFDDWWHNTYGLDVKIVSPPHALLGLGMFMVALGVLLVMLAWQNCSRGAEQRRAGLLFGLTAGLMITMLSVYSTQDSWPNLHHSFKFYRASAVLYCFMFAMVGRAARFRWPVTFTAIVYTSVRLLMTWILPLFAAQPKLAPVYRQVDHMVPPAFPVLLIFSAIALDLIFQWFGRRQKSANETGKSSGWLQNPFWRDWLLAALMAVAFLGIELAVQWPFSRFLLSPLANNWFFAGGRVWPYYTQPGNWVSIYWSELPLTVGLFGKAVLIGIISSRLGLGFGRWMQEVKR